MLKSLSLLATAALLGATAFVPAPKAAVFGFGGMVGHDGHIDGGPTAIRIDAVEGRLWGQVLLAGEEHGPGHGHEEGGGSAKRGPAVYPELHINSTRIRSVEIKSKLATIVAFGHYVSGVNEGDAIPVVITVTVEDGKGKKGEDHIAVSCKTSDGVEVFSRHGVMNVGDIKVSKGGKS